MALHHVICYTDILVGIDVDVHNDFVFVDFFIFFLVVRRPWCLDGSNSGWGERLVWRPDLWAVEVHESQCADFWVGPKPSFERKAWAITLDRLAPSRSLWSWKIQSYPLCSSLTRLLHNVKSQHVKHWFQERSQSWLHLKALVSVLLRSVLELKSPLSTSCRVFHAYQEVALTSLLWCRIGFRVINYKCGLKSSSHIVLYLRMLCTKAWICQSVSICGALLDGGFGECFCQVIPPICLGLHHYFPIDVKYETHGSNMPTMWWGLHSGGSWRV